MPCPDHFRIHQGKTICMWQPCCQASCVAAILFLTVSNIWSTLALGTAPSLRKDSVPTRKEKVGRGPSKPSVCASVSTYTFSREGEITTPLISYLGWGLS